MPASPAGSHCTYSTPGACRTAARRPTPPPCSSPSSPPNAVTHGRVPGRDFEVTARLLGRTLRIEVSDTRGELRPLAPGAPRPALGPLAETGRGLLLVETLADRWEVLDRVPVGKTVVAELNLRR
ncbi:anti-sigma regulatory factor (Ser/Thr protein kinase) [Streptomyces sp. B3I7]|nr:anti-sigma regulatory factor (Ser/Thr protein kinase) [Streptomyces sp. B3I7]